MQAHTNSFPAISTIVAHAQRLAPLLDRSLTMEADANGLIHVSNPRNGRMRQAITLIDRDGELWWAWLWPGPAPGTPFEVEPMVPARYEDEAARRINKVLHTAEPEQVQP